MKDISHHFNDRHITDTDFCYLPPDEESHPEPIYMGGGRPHVALYPITQIDLHIQSKPCSDVSEKVEIHQEDGELTLSTYLQYAPYKGHEAILGLARDLVTSLQSPPYDVDYLVTTGSGDSLTKLLSVFTSPGDTILVENFSYTPIFGPMASLGVTKVPFPLIFESGGPVIDVSSLSEILDTWETDRYNGMKKPKIIYTVPTQNPMGITQPRTTMIALYQLCQRHDLIIFEDDPDGYISFTELGTFETYKSSIQSSSYLSIDVDGRVFRMETFSKLFCRGIRLGFIAAQKEAIDRLMSYSKTFTKAASGISQLILAKAVEYFGGGANGYLKWCYNVSKEYSIRKECAFNYLSQCESVKKGYLVPVEPDGGMFFVLKVSLLDSASIQEDMERLYYKCLKAGVIVILGRDMTWDPTLKHQAKFLRVLHSQIWMVLRVVLKV
jgi:aromatic amino acid aminotransferase II